MAEPLKSIANRNSTTVTLKSLRNTPPKDVQQAFLYQFQLFYFLLRVLNQQFQTQRPNVFRGNDTWRAAKGSFIRYLQHTYLGEFLESQDLKLGSRRSHLQMLAQVLDFCHKPQSKIRVMQNACTSYRLVTRYLLELQVVGFLEETEGGNKYATTARGRAFLEKWHQLEGLWPRGKICCQNQNHSPGKEENRGIITGTRDKLQIQSP